MILQQEISPAKVSATRKGVVGISFFVQDNALAGIFEMKKVCFKCGAEKEIDEFYKHKDMRDGHLNKCKLCTKMDTSEREAVLSMDEGWRESERRRHRDKYYRLNYKEKHKPTSEAKREAMSKYNKRYPEKLIAKRMSSKMKPSITGNQLHHWSYKKAHWTDVIELSVRDHMRLHRYIKYDVLLWMYRIKETDELLDTREKHIEFINTIKDRP